MSGSQWESMMHTLDCMKHNRMHHKDDKWPKDFSNILILYFSLRYAEQLAAIPRFARLGPLFKSSAPVELTEAETEYMVRCVKHTFLNYIVLQV